MVVLHIMTSMETTRTAIQDTPKPREASPSFGITRQGAILGLKARRISLSKAQVFRRISKTPLDGYPARTPNSNNILISVTLPNDTQVRDSISPGPNHRALYSVMQPSLFLCIFGSAAFDGQAHYIDIPLHIIFLLPRYFVRHLHLNLLDSTVISGMENVSTSVYISIVWKEKQKHIHDIFCSSSRNI